MANTTATNPITTEIHQLPAPGTVMAPTTVMPLTALAPDISGVCSVGGTRLMSATPRKVASVKITMPRMSVSSIRPPGARHTVPHDADGADDRVIKLQSQAAIGDEVIEEGLDVAAVHLAGMIGQRRGEIDRAEDGDPMLLHGLARTGELAVAT